MFDESNYDFIPVNGYQSGLICPFCNGGQSRERSFIVSRPSGFWNYKCYRNACLHSGHYPDRGYVFNSELAKPVRDRPDNSYKGRIEPLDDIDVDYFLERFDLDFDDLPRTWIGVTVDNRYIFQVHDPEGYTRGHVLRMPNWKGSPKPVRISTSTGRSKSMNCMLPGSLPMHWCNFGTPDTLWVVEDHMSAYRLLSHGQNAVALLGTTLNIPKAMEIRQTMPDLQQTIFALDPDATSQAYALARKWSGLLGLTRVEHMSLDPKDLPRAELNEIIGWNTA